MKSPTKKRRIYFSFILLSLLALSSCGGIGTMRAWLKDDSLEKKLKELEELNKGPHVIVHNKTYTASAAEHSTKFALMALFAKVVYRWDLPEEIRDEQSCAYLSSSGKAPDFGMPRSDKNQYGWERWASSGENYQSCYSNTKDGLSYETYVYHDDTGCYQTAVIAFRGTENRKGEIVSDWSTNLSAFFGFEPKQYSAAQNNLKGLVAAIKGINPPGLDGCHINIYATGHSLGGGLAQQAGYYEGQIDEVFAFDTSPVTNWSKLKLKGLIEEDFPVIHRVHHKKEFLSNARKVSTFFNTLRLNRTDYMFDFKDGSGAELHEMGILTCNLSKILSKSGKKSKYFYPPSQAIKFTSNKYGEQYPGGKHPICGHDEQVS